MSAETQRIQSLPIPPKNAAERDKKQFQFGINFSAAKLQNPEIKHSSDDTLIIFHCGLIIPLTCPLQVFAHRTGVTSFMEGVLLMIFLKIKYSLNNHGCFNVYIRVDS